MTWKSFPSICISFGSQFQRGIGKSALRALVRGKSVLSRSATVCFTVNKTNCIKMDHFDSNLMQPKETVNVVHSASPRRNACKSFTMDLDMYNPSTANRLQRFKTIYRSINLRSPPPCTILFSSILCVIYVDIFFFAVKSLEIFRSSILMPCRGICERDLTNMQSCNVCR